MSYNKILFILFQASFAAECAVFEVLFPFNSIATKASDLFTLQVLPPQTYSIKSLVVPHHAVINRISQNEFQIQSREVNFTASIVIEQCEISGSYLIRLLDREKTIVGKINGAYFHFIDSRISSQSQVTKVPVVTSHWPHILLSGKQVTLKIEQSSFDYRKPIKCVFITDQEIIFGQNQIQSNSYTQITCDVPKQFKQGYLSVMSGQALSQLQSIQTQEVPTLVGVTPSAFHVNHQDQNIALTISQNSLKNIWVRFMGQQRIYTAVRLSQTEFLFRVNLDYLLPNVNQPKTTNYIELSINEQDFIASDKKITLIPPFTVTHIARTLYPADVDFQIEMFATLVDPKCVYACVIRNSFDKVKAYIVQNDFTHSDERSRNSKYKIVCTFKPQKQSAFVGLESNGIQSYYGELIKFEGNQPPVTQHMRAQTKSFRGYQHDQLVFEQKQANDVLILFGEYPHPHQSDCEFLGESVRIITSSQSLNSTIGTCQLPVLDHGKYQLNVDGSQFHIKIIATPTIKHQNKVMVTGPVKLKFDSPIERLNSHNVTCSYNDLITTGVLVSNPFSSNYDGVECELPQSDEQSLLTLTEVKINQIKITTVVKIVYLPYPNGFYIQSLDQYLVPQDILDFKNLLPALDQVPDQNCTFEFLSISRHYTVPLEDMKCVFSPKLEFDEIIESCRHTLLKVAGVTITNQLTFCGENFVFVDRVWPLMAVTNQFALTLSRDVKVEQCRLGQLVVGQMDGNICTIKNLQKLPFDFPLEIEIAYRGRWYPQSPDSLKVIRPKNLPSFVSEKLLNPYDVNTIFLTGYNLIRNSTYFVKLDNGTLKQIPKVGELNKVQVSQMPVLQSLELLMVTNDDQTILLQPLQLDYLPKITSSSSLFKLQQREKITIDLDQLVVVQAVRTRQQVLQFDQRSYGVHTRVEVHTDDLDADEEFQITIQADYQGYNVNVITNTTVIYNTQTKINFLSVVDRGLMISSTPPASICTVKFADGVMSEAQIVRNLCTITDLQNALSVSVGNSEPLQLCHKWVKVEFDELVFDHMTTIKVNQDDLVLLHQDGYIINHFNGTYHAWWDGEAEITIKHDKCVLHGQTKYTQRVIEPFYITNLTNDDSNVVVHLSTPITQLVLSKMNLTFDQEQIDTFNGLMSGRIYIDENEVRVDSSMPNKVELSYKHKKINFVRGSDQVQDLNLTEACNQEVKELQLANQTFPIQDIRYELNKTYENKTEPENHQKNLIFPEPVDEKIVVRHQTQEVFRPYEREIINITKSLQFLSQTDQPVVLRKFNGTQPIVVLSSINLTGVMQYQRQKQEQRLQISYQKLRLRNTFVPQILQIKIKALASQVLVTCLPLQPTSYYLISNETLVIYYEHISIQIGQINCTINELSLEIQVLDVPAVLQNQVKLLTNQGRQVIIPVQDQVVCAIKGMLIKPLNNFCTVETWKCDNPCQVDLILPVSDFTSLVLQTYQIVQQELISDVQSSQFISHQSTDIFKSKKLSEFYKLNKSNLTLVVCQHMCINKTLVEFNSLSDSFSFESSEQANFTEQKVTVTIQVKTQYGVFDTQTLILTWVDNPVYEMPSPTYMVDGKIFNKPKNLILQLDGNLKLGPNQAILSLLPTKQPFQFTLINLGSPVIKLDQPTITDDVVKVPIVYEDQHNSLHQAKVFYKRTEQLLLSQDQERWYLFFGVQDFKQRSFEDITVQIGDHFIQVEPLKLQDQPQQQVQKSQNFPNVTILFEGPDVLVKEIEDTQIIRFQSYVTGEEYTCRYEILPKNYRYLKTYKNGLSFACGVPKLRHLGNFVNFDILLADNVVFTKVIPVVEIFTFNATVISETQILVQSDTKIPLLCSINGSHTFESINQTAYTIRVPFVSHGSVVQCGRQDNNQQYLSYYRLIDSQVQTAIQQYFDQQSLQVIEISPQLVVLQRSMIKITFNMQITTSEFQIKLKASDGQVYEVTLDKEQQFEMPQMHDVSWVELYTKSLKPLHSRVYFQGPLQYVNPRLIMTKSKTFLLMSSQSESTIPSNQLKIQAVTDNLRVLESVNCTYLLNSDVLCQFTQKFFDDHTYTLKTIFNDVVISQTSINTTSDGQQSYDVAVSPLEQLGPELKFNIQSRNLRPATCYLIDHNTQTSQVQDNSCSFYTQSTRANLIVYDHDGFLIYENTVKIAEQPVVESITPNFLVQSLQAELVITLSRPYDVTGFTFIDLPFTQVNPTQFQVTVPQQWQTQSLQAYMTHLASNRIVEIDHLITVYSEIIKNPVLQQKWIDSRSRTNLQIDAQHIAPFNNFQIKLDNRPCTITAVTNTTIYFQLDQGMPQGEQILDLFHGKELLARFGALIFQKYVQAFHKTILVAQTSFFDYQLFIELPESFKIFGNFSIECEINQLKGQVQVIVNKLMCKPLFLIKIVSQHQDKKHLMQLNILQRARSLYCRSIQAYFGSCDHRCHCLSQQKQGHDSKARLSMCKPLHAITQTQINLEFFVKDRQRISIAQDTQTFQIVPVVQQVHTNTKVLIQNLPVVIDIQLQSGFVPQQTFCIIGKQFAQINLSNGNFSCSFPQVQSGTGQVLLEVSNYFDAQQVHNKVQTGYLDLIPNPAPHGCLIDFNPNVIFQGQKQQITASIISDQRIQYKSYRNLETSCHIYNSYQITAVRCQFTDQLLNAIRIDLPAYKFKQGDYLLTLRLNQYTFQFNETLRFEQPPQITSLFPTKIHISKGSEPTVLLIFGRNFLAFSFDVRCVVNFDSNKILFLDAVVVSDTQIRCVVEPMQKYGEAYISIKSGNQKVELNYQKKQPKVLITSPVQLLQVSPKVVSVGSQQSTFVDINHKLSFKNMEVKVDCTYYISDQQVQLSQAIEVTDQQVQCESIQQLQQTIETTVELSLKITYSFESLTYKFQSINQALITAVPKPTITATEPTVVYNLITFKQLAVKGNNFYNSINLVCMINGVTVPATFVSSGYITCPINKLERPLLKVQVSNDYGQTLSDQINVPMVTNLPRFDQLDSPNVFFVGLNQDVTISGTNLYEIQIKIGQSQFAYCNSTSDGTKIQCFDIYFSKPGMYKIQFKNPATIGFFQSRIVIQVFPQILFKGISKAVAGQAKLNLPVDQLIQIRQISPQAVIECHVFGDDAAIRYKTKVIISVYDAYCLIDCSSYSRFLEFQVWIDTVRLTSSTTSRYFCQPQLDPTIQIYKPIPLPDPGIKPQPIILLPELTFNVTITNSTKASPKNLVLSKPVYDRICSVFPSACLVYSQPYFQQCTVSGGMTNKKYLIVQRQERRTVDFWGHDLDVNNPICVFDGVRVAAVAMSKFNIQCLTPDYESVTDYSKTTVDVQVIVGSKIYDSQSKCQIKLIQLPQLTYVNRGRKAYVDLQRQIPIELGIEYPDQWFDSGYQIDLVVYCNPNLQSKLTISSNDQALISQEFAATVYQNSAGVSHLQCTLFLTEKQRPPVLGSQLQQSITFLFEMDKFRITSVDHNTQFVDQKDKVLLISLQGLSLDLVTSQFNDLKFVLRGNNTVKSDYVTQSKVIGQLTVVFKSRDFQDGNYCLEAQIGDHAISQTCSQILKFINQPTIWQIVDEVVNQHSLQSVVKGAYLEGLSLAGISCLYQRYNGSNVYITSHAPAILNGVDFQCVLPNVFYSYFSSDKIFTLGLTTQALGGQQVNQSNPNAQQTINPNRPYQKLPIQSSPATHCQSQSFVNPTCKVDYIKHDISCKSNNLVQATPGIVDNLIPDHSLIDDPAMLQIQGYIFDNQTTYICVFSDDYVTQAIYSSQKLITCQTPKMNKNQTTKLVVKVFTQDGVFVHMFTKRFTYYSCNSISEIYPLLAPTATPTQLLLTVSNLVANNRIRVNPIVCKFNFQFDGKAGYSLSPAQVQTVISDNNLTYDAIVSCLTPDLSLQLNNPNKNYTDTFVAITEFDGTYRLDQQIRFTFVNQIVVTGIEPNQGYVSQTHLVTIKGSNFLPEASLKVRMRSNLEIPNQGYRILFEWDFDDIFFVDQQTLVVRIPEVLKLDLRDCNQSLFQVSINNGTSWTSETTAVYTFKPTPVITFLDHYGANLRAFFPLVIQGLNFDENITTCLFGQNLQSNVTFVNSTVVKCIVPVVWDQKTVQFALMTKDNFMINDRIYNFTFANEVLIRSIIPIMGGTQGGYQFTLYGDFQILVGSKFKLFWNSLDISANITRVRKEYLMGVVPPALYPGRAEISIEKDLVVYMNISVSFVYGLQPQVTSFFPNSGPSSGGTMVTLKGENFNDQIVCEFANSMQIVPIRIDAKTIVCQMPPNPQTDPLPFNLILWNGNQYLQTNYTYFYFNDIIINDYWPKNITTKVRDQDLTVNITGLWFQQQVNTTSLKVRINQIVLPDEDVEFVNSTFIRVKPPNVEQPGPQYIFVSNNFGANFAKGSSYLHLNYYEPHQIKSVYPDHVQIPVTDNDNDTIKMNLTVKGNFYPTNSDFYCRLFDDDAAPLFKAQIIKAQVINSTTLMCNDIWLFNASVVPQAQYFRVQVSLNLQEYWGDVYSLYYYPKVQVTGMNYYVFSTTEERLTFEVFGANFINTVQQLSCKITNQNTSDSYLADHVFYGSPNNISCTFNKDPLIQPGTYRVSVANNDQQFVNCSQTFEIRPPIYMVNVWPKTFLTQTNGDLIYIHAVGFLDDVLCYFVPSTPTKGALFKTPSTQLIVKANQVNQTHVSCVIPQDLTDVGQTVIEVHLGNQLNLINLQQSGFQIRVLDHCPNGYFCTNRTMFPCPKGHYCPGDSYLQDVRKCPIGYYQPKARSQRCYPCLKGHYCDREAMVNPTPCPEASICDIHKLQTPRNGCPPGMYCLNTTQGNDPWYNGYIVNLTMYCEVGTYCRGGFKSGAQMIPYNYEAVPTACQRGHICHQNSELGDGQGACPSGYFCPHRNHTGILCPPRFYCPGRGNIEPIKCPKGTFNIHFGQKNCTDCTLGRICPTDGMLLPMVCPAGMICNDEGLVIATHVCTAGHICLSEVSSGLTLEERSCKILQIIDGVNKCNSISYPIQNFTTLITNKLPTYFMNQGICCKTSDQIADWMMGIGDAINEPQVFAYYATQMQKYTYQYLDNEGNFQTLPLWDGLKIVDQHLKGKSISKSDGVNLVSKRHEQIIRIAIQKMYTKYQQLLCPGGRLCLIGVNTFTVDGYLISAPFPCPSGSFCFTASQSVVGTSLCPAGYFCPPDSDQPQPTPPGTFSGNPGSVEPSLCQPGTFTLNSQSVKCNSCPSGYQCKERGTTMPQICMAGEYRSVTESNICSQCPKGTFSFERGAKDYTDCQGCPPGRICEVEGLQNITQTQPCPDGRICKAGTGGETQPTDCPPGYFCPEQTDEKTMFNNPCLKGFFCRPGTGASTRTRDNCPQTYFCPAGSGAYNYVTDYTNYDNWESDAPTRCPRGTGDDGSDTKTSLLQCTVNSNFKMMIASVSIRDNYPPDPTDVKPVVSTTSTERLLQSVQVASKDDPMLKSLWEIEFEIYRARDTSNPPNQIRPYLNTERQYLMRINPVNLSLADRWFANETQDSDTERNNEPSLIFKLRPNSYALVTVDVRHLMEQNQNFVYGEDFVISLTIGQNLSLTDNAYPVLMPEEFLNANTTKSQVLEFEILALNTVYMRIDVLIYNSLYLNYKWAFINSTSVEIRTPDRAIYGTEEIFITAIQEDYMIMLPFNQPMIQPDKTSLPDFTLTFSNYKLNKWKPTMHASTKNRNIWIPDSLYWNLRSTINLPYIPYFSNCNGYGSYIPLWSLYEQNNLCDQYTPENINYMSEFSFGQSPTADNCNGIQIQCMYDEILGAQQPLPRWFETEGGQNIFNIVVNPVNYEEMMTQEFSASEILSVASNDGNSGSGFVPGNFDFTISYYQNGPKVKKIITVELDFNNFITLSQEQSEGNVPTFYNLTFSFLPLSHKDLLIQFAFQSYLYLVLYLVIGLLSIVLMTIVAVYHRLMARPFQGKIVKFRFVSYFLLTEPYAFKGVLLALMPLVLGNVLIIIIMYGQFLTTNTAVFDCDAPNNSDCVLTIFDMVKPDPDLISIDYEILRNGRCGVSMLITGVYLLFVGLTMLIPDISNKLKVHESYNGNIWNFYEWKRSNMMFMSMWIMFFGVTLLQFSFSDTFGDNIWTIVALVKIGANFIENICEKTLEEKILVMPMSIYLDTILGLVTFGSDDFLAFIDCYFIEFGIMLFERNYFSQVVPLFFDYAENKLPAVITTFINWINTDNQEEEGQIDIEKNLFGKKEKNEDSETSDSKVMLSDENSLLDEAIAGSDSQRDQELLYKVHQEWNQQSDSDSDLSEKFKKPIKNNTVQLSRTEMSGIGQQISYDSETVTLSSHDLKSSESEQEDALTIEDSVEEVEVEDMIDLYADYAGDNVSLYYSPFFIFLLWIFYNQTVVASNYGIKSYDFIYYFLFSLTIVPFQVVVDIIQLNLSEWYLQMPIHDYLDYLSLKYLQRKTPWKGDDGQINDKIEKGLRTVDALCFSDQFYFQLTIYIAGMCEITLGIQTLLYLPEYNMFGDFGVLPVVGFNIIQCLLIHRGCLLIGGWLGIWKVDEAIAGKATENSSKKEDLFILLDMIADFIKEDFQDKEDEVPDHLRYKIKAWNQIERIKIKDAQLKADLRTDRMMAENFKELFLQYNKPWLRDNLQEVLTPRTIFGKRQIIIEQLGKILGPIEADVTPSDKDKKSDSDSKATLSDSEVIKRKEKARVGRLIKKYGIQGAKITSLIASNQVTPVTKVIIKYWITRMRMIRKLRVYVQNLIDLNLEPQCQYCSYTYGLQVELLQSIEDMFYQFLEESGQKISNFNFQLWLKYFKIHARYRTICQECMEKAQIYRKMQLKKERLIKAIGAGNQDDLEMILMKNSEKEQKLKQIKKLTTNTTREIIRSWVQVAKKSLEIQQQQGEPSVQEIDYRKTPKDVDDVELSKFLGAWND